VPGIHTNLSPFIATTRKLRGFLGVARGCGWPAAQRRFPRPRGGPHSLRSVRATGPQGAVSAQIRTPAGFVR